MDGKGRGNERGRGRIQTCWVAAIDGIWGLTSQSSVIDQAIHVDLSVPSFVGLSHLPTLRPLWIPQSDDSLSMADAAKTTAGAPIAGHSGRHMPRDSRGLYALSTARRAAVPVRRTAAHDQQPGSSQIMRLIFQFVRLLPDCSTPIV